MNDLFDLARRYAEASPLIQVKAAACDVLDGFATVEEAADWVDALPESDSFSHFTARGETVNMVILSQAIGVAEDMGDFVLGDGGMHFVKDIFSAYLRAI